MTFLQLTPHFAAKRWNFLLQNYSQLEVAEPQKLKVSRCLFCRPPILESPTTESVEGASTITMKIVMIRPSFEKMSNLTFQRPFFSFFFLRIHITAMAPHFDIANPA